MKIFLIALSLILSSQSFAQNGPAMGGSASGSATVAPGTQQPSNSATGTAQGDVIMEGPSQRNVDTIIPADDTHIRGTGDLNTRPKSRQNMNKNRKNQRINNASEFYYESDVDMRYQEINE